MNLDDVRKLIELVSRSDVARLELTIGDTRICIEKGSSPQRPPVSARPQSTDRESPRPPTPVEMARLSPSRDRVCAPTDGIIHLRPAPNAAPFVREGQSVAAGDPVCLIEVMKTFHTINASRPGTVKAIIVEDGQNVRFDDPLVELA
jgi:acetyl-CoA carboxylase biotin carboxyl carrier protein